MTAAVFSESAPAAPPEGGTPAIPRHEPDAPPRLAQDTSDFNVVFIHSRLDDYGLSAPAFRIYAHLARRAGQGEAWPGIQSMARVCRLHPQTVRRAVATLIRHRLIERTLRPGLTPLYTVTKASRWQPPRHISDPCETDTAPPVSEHAPAKRIQGHPSEKDAAEGNPSEGNPRKNQIHTPRARGGIPCNEDEALEQAKLVGVPPEFARVEFCRLESVGWVNGAGNPVRKWVPHLRKRWADDQSQRAERLARAAARPGRNAGFTPPRKFDAANYNQPIDTI